MRRPIRRRRSGRIWPRCCRNAPARDRLTGILPSSRRRSSWPRMAAVCRDPVALLFDIHVLFRAVPGAGYFCFGVGARLRATVTWHFAVIPATEPLATDGSCLPGPVTLLLDVHVLFRAVPRRGLLLFRRRSAPARDRHLAFCRHPGDGALGHGWKLFAGTQWLCCSTSMSFSAPSRAAVPRETPARPFPRARLRCPASCTAPQAHFDTAIHGLLYGLNARTRGRCSPCR
jgi:hypothetical protein